MPRRAVRCLVDLNLSAVSAPGCWLPSKEECYLSVSLFSQFKNTQLLGSTFPILVNESFKFEKTYFTSLEVEDVSDLLQDELVVIELLQLSEYSDGAVHLATYTNNVRDFLYPYETNKTTFVSRDRDIFLERTVAFPGISPKLEFSSRVTLKESYSEELDALEDAIDYHKSTIKDIRRSKRRPRSLSPTRRKNRKQNRELAPEGLPERRIVDDFEVDYENYPNYTPRARNEGRSFDDYKRFTQERDRTRTLQGEGTGDIDYSNYESFTERRREGLRAYPMDDMDIDVYRKRPIRRNVRPSGGRYPVDDMELETYRRSPREKVPFRDYSVDDMDVDRYRNQPRPAMDGYYPPGYTDRGFGQVSYPNDLQQRYEPQSRNEQDRIPYSTDDYLSDPFDSGNFSFGRRGSPDDDFNPYEGSPRYPSDDLDLDFRRKPRYDRYGPTDNRDNRFRPSAGDLDDQLRRRPELGGRKVYPADDMDIYLGKLRPTFDDDDDDESLLGYTGPFETESDSGLRPRTKRRAKKKLAPKSKSNLHTPTIRRKSASPRRTASPRRAPSPQLKRSNEPASSRRARPPSVPLAKNTPRRVMRKPVQRSSDFPNRTLIQRPVSPGGVPRLRRSASPGQAPLYQRSASPSAMPRRQKPSSGGTPRRRRPDSPIGTPRRQRPSSGGTPRRQRPTSPGRTPMYQRPSSGGTPRRQLPSSPLGTPRRQRPTSPLVTPRRQRPTSPLGTPRHQRPTSPLGTPRRQRPTSPGRAPMYQRPEQMPMYQRTPPERRPFYPGHPSPEQAPLYQRPTSQEREPMYPTPASRQMPLFPRPTSPNRSSLLQRPSSPGPSLRQRPPSPQNFQSTRPPSPRRTILRPGSPIRSGPAQRPGSPPRMTPQRDGYPSMPRPYTGPVGTGPRYPSSAPPPYPSSFPTQSASPLRLNPRNNMKDVIQPEDFTSLPPRPQVVNHKQPGDFSSGYGKPANLDYRYRSPSPTLSQRIEDIDLYAYSDNRPPFVVRKLDSDLIGRQPGGLLAANAKSKPRKNKIATVSFDGYNDLNAYTNIKRNYAKPKFSSFITSQLPKYSSRRYFDSDDSDLDDDSEVAGYTSRIRPSSRARSVSPGRGLRRPRSVSPRGRISAGPGLSSVPAGDRSSRRDYISPSLRARSPFRSGLDDPPLSYYGRDVSPKPDRDDVSNLKKLRNKKGVRKIPRKKVDPRNDKENIHNLDRNRPKSLLNKKYDPLLDLDEPVRDIADDNSSVRTDDSDRGQGIGNRFPEDGYGQRDKVGPVGYPRDGREPNTKRNRLGTSPRRRQDPFDSRRPQMTDYRDGPGDRSAPNRDPLGKDPYAPVQDPYAPVQDPYALGKDSYAPVQDPYAPVQRYIPVERNPYGRNPTGPLTRDGAGFDGDRPEPYSGTDPYPRNRTVPSGGSADPYFGADPYVRGQTDPAGGGLDPLAGDRRDPYGRTQRGPYTRDLADPFITPGQNPYAGVNADPYSIDAQNPYSKSPYTQNSYPLGFEQAPYPYGRNPADPYTGDITDPNRGPFDAIDPADPYSRAGPNAIDPYSRAGPNAIDPADPYSRAGPNAIDPFSRADPYRSGSDPNIRYKPDTGVPYGSDPVDRYQQDPTARTRVPFDPTDSFDPNKTRNFDKPIGYEGGRYDPVIIGSDPYAVGTGREAGRSPVRGARSPVRGAREAGRSPVRGARKAGRSPLRGARVAGRSPVRDAREAGRSPVRDAMEAGRSPVRGAREAGRSPVRGARSPVRAGREAGRRSPVRAGRSTVRGGGEASRRSPVRGARSPVSAGRSPIIAGRADDPEARIDSNRSSSPSSEVIYTSKVKTSSTTRQFASGPLSSDSVRSDSPVRSSTRRSVQTEIHKSPFSGTRDSGFSGAMTADRPKFTDFRLYHDEESNVGVGRVSRRDQFEQDKLRSGQDDGLSKEEKNVRFERSCVDEAPGVDVAGDELDSVHISQSSNNFSTYPFDDEASDVAHDGLSKQSYSYSKSSTQQYPATQDTSTIGEGPEWSKRRSDRFSPRTCRADAYYDQVLLDGIEKAPLPSRPVSPVLNKARFRDRFSESPFFSTSSKLSERAVERSHRYRYPTHDTLDDLALDTSLAKYRRYKPQYLY